MEKLSLGYSVPKGTQVQWRDTGQVGIDETKLYIELYPSKLFDFFTLYEGLYPCLFIMT